MPATTFRSRWQPGILTAPHGVAFDGSGNLFVSEFNVFGRVHRFPPPQTHAEINAVRKAAHL